MPGLDKPTRLVVLFAAFAAFVFPAQASAFVYWSNEAPGGPIGRADLDGGDVNQGFLHGDSPEGIASEGTHVYWTNYNEGTIGRAGSDGSEPDQSFISGAKTPFGLAVGADHIYWTNVINNTIGRANLDGSEADQSFISANSPGGIAVGDEHVYWVNEGTDTIGRANLEGGEVEQSFISAPGAIAIAVDGHHLYWTDNNTGAIERANLDGSDVEADFITGAHSPQAIALDADHVYWANYSTGTIGRANLDGTGVEEEFITGADGPLGLAVDSQPHATSTSLRCAPSPLVLPASTTCTVTVTDTGPFPSAPGPISPTGTVSLSSNVAGAFRPGTACVLQAEAAGRSTCALAYAPSQVGIPTVSATYGGDPAHTGSSGSLVLSVEPPVPALTGRSPRPSNVFRLGRARLDRRKGLATVPVTVPGPGSLLLTGRGVRRLLRSAPRAGKVTLALRPTKKERGRLRKTGGIRVKFTVAFTPRGGEAASRDGRVTLRLKPTRHRHR